MWWLIIVIHMEYAMAAQVSGAYSSYEDCEQQMDEAQPKLPEPKTYRDKVDIYCEMVPEGYPQINITWTE